MLLCSLCCLCMCIFSVYVCNFPCCSAPWALAFLTAPGGRVSFCGTFSIAINRNARSLFVYSCFYPESSVDESAGYVPGLASPISGEITALSAHSSSVGRCVHARLPPAHPFVCLLRFFRFCSIALAGPGARYTHTQYRNTLACVDLGHFGIDGALDHALRVKWI